WRARATGCAHDPRARADDPAAWAGAHCVGRAALSRDHHSDRTPLPSRVSPVPAVADFVISHPRRKTIASRPLGRASLLVGQPRRRRSQMPMFLTRIVAGFIAGALAVLVFHQGMYVLIQYLDANVDAFKQAGSPLRGTPFNTASGPLWPELLKALNQPAVTLPVIVNQSIWGGLWGILFAFLVDHIPTGPTFIRALVFAFIFPSLLGWWLLVPLINGTPPILGGAMAKGGFDWTTLRYGFLLNTVA